MRLAAVRSIARIEAARCGSRTNVLAELLTTETDRAGQSVHTLTLPAAAAQRFFAAVPSGRRCSCTDGCRASVCGGANGGRALTLFGYSPPSVMFPFVGSTCKFVWCLRCATLATAYE